MIVTYRVQSSREHYDIDVANPTSIYRLDADVRLPVSIRTYLSKSGSAMYGLKLKGAGDDNF